MIFAKSFSGFCVGCVVFSGIDQNGTVRSVHKFDGCVSRKFPSEDFSQSFGAPFSVYGARTLRFVLTAFEIECEFVGNRKKPNIFRSIFPISLCAATFFAFPRYPVSQSEIFHSDTLNRRSRTPIAANINRSRRLSKVSHNSLSQDSSQISYSSSEVCLKEFSPKFFVRLYGGSAKSKSNEFSGNFLRISKASPQIILF